MHLNDLFTLFGARLVRNSTFARFRALEAELQNCKRASNLVSCDPSGLVRIILNEIASNQIDASSALGAIFKDINVAGQLVAATEAAAWLHQYADKVPGFARRPELLESIIPRIPADGDLAEFVYSRVPSRASCARASQAGYITPSILSTAYQRL
jgi:hypothetical protein